MSKPAKEEDEKTFENAFKRLEEILEKMNEGNISLDESLRLYEEADALISFCDKKLKGAEKKIETLIKNRQGELLTDENGPIKEPF